MLAMGPILNGIQMNISIHASILRPSPFLCTTYFFWDSYVGFLGTSLIWHMLPSLINCKHIALVEITHKILMERLSLQSCLYVCLLVSKWQIMISSHPDWIVLVICENEHSVASLIK